MKQHTPGIQSPNGPADRSTVRWPLTFDRKPQNMIVLIVGPSGVGKTITYKAVEPQFPDAIFRHLDGLAAQWAFQHGIIDRECVTLLDRTINTPSLFHSIGLFAIGKLSGENPGKHLVIDFGAGFQVAPTAAHLYRLFPVIAITAAPEVAYKRIKEARNDARTIDQYRQQEFSSNRVSVYNSAQDSVDTSNQSREETCGAVLTILSRLLKT